jgi:ESS family glutamate:Na+ symporter
MIGIIYALLGRFTCAGNYLDRESLLNISGASLEFLIVFSIAATNLRVFFDYALELVILSVFTALSTLIYVFFFGKRWHRNHWVENSLGTFGIATGVLATGFLLIRIADPDNRTGAALNLSIAASLTTTSVQMYFLVLYPPMIVRHPGLALGVALAGMIVFTIAGIILSRNDRIRA